MYDVTIGGDIVKVLLDKVSSWIEKHWWAKVSIAIIVVFGLPMLLAKGMEWGAFKNIPGSNSDWFSFLGGYVGAIITIGGVYWQVRKQTVADKEADFRKARPLFLISIVNEEEKNNVSYYGNLSFWLYHELKKVLSKVKEEKFKQIKIHNISEETMNAVKVVIKWNDNIEDTVKIETITGHEECRIITKKSLDKMYYKREHDQKEVSSGYDSLKEVDVYFHTPIREKIKLVFEYKDETLVYKNKYLENKGDKIDDYNLDGFVESDKRTP